MSTHTHPHTPDSDMPDIIFYMNLYGKDESIIAACVNQGIDSRLEAFTHEHAEFTQTGRGLLCEFYTTHGLQIMIRRLLDLESGRAERLADDIVFVQYGYEVI